MNTISDIKKNIKRKLLEGINEALIKGNSCYAIDLGKLLDKIRYTEKGDEDYKDNK